MPSAKVAQPRKAASERSERAAPTDRTTRKDPVEAVRAGGLSLWVVTDEGTSTHVLPAGGRVVVGRSRVAGVRVDHPSVSREHLALHVAEPPRVEDLGSANGTRLRGVALTRGVPIEVRPDEVIDLGGVMLVLRDRALSSRRDRTCHPALFELRVEDEEARLDASGRPFAVARVQVHGERSRSVVEVIIAAGLEAGDAACSPAPGCHDILLVGAEPADALARLDRIERQLADRGVRVGSSLTCHPRDGSATKTLRGGRAGTRHGAPAPAGPIARDEAMTRVLRLLERVGRSSLRILLLGETGVGKEVCASFVHQVSPRAGGPFVPVNCAALPEGLVDAELFGHERGAFTGAVADRIGLIESASGGTLFLDEIGDMPLATQVRLLRVLEAQEVTRVGSNKARPIDVRVVVATHRDLAEAVTLGRFREDLYHRLNGISVLVPPLRERVEDIEPLARHFLAGFAKGKAPPVLSPASVAHLRRRAWPGNVRELRNVVERAVALCEGSIIEPEHLIAEPGASRGDHATPPDSTSVVSGLRGEVGRLERERITAALDACGGSQRSAARRLGISRGALLRRLERLGIPRSRRV